MLSVIKQNKWVLAVIVLVFALITGLSGYSFRITQQATAVTLWSAGRLADLEQVWAAFNKADAQSLTEARTRAVSLDQELEKAYSGLSGLKLNEELIFAIKMWQMPVSRIRQLLEQANDETVRRQISDLLSTAQLEANKLLEASEKEAGRLQAIARTAYLAAMWLTLLAGAGFIAALLVLQKRYTAKEKQLHDTLRQESLRNEMLTGFIEAVSSGNYQVELKGTHDPVLAERLQNMRDKLRTSAEEEARRNRAANGLAQIGEILRSTHNAAELHDRIIKFVVTFTKSNQGGLFLLREEPGSKEPYLELVSAYAYERKKFITKRVDVGQGLVGQCFLEGQRIFMAKVPEQYIHITSGLGEANPRCVLLVPLKTEDTVLGVMELATFNTYDEHEIELIEKFAGSIASTLANVQINENTRLLLEQTQQQAEEMRAQEEEMRQNMEELAATQEEMSRKEQEYIRRIRELEEQLGIRTTTPETLQNRQ